MEEETTGQSLDDSRQGRYDLEKNEGGAHKEV